MRDRCIRCEAPLDESQVCPCLLFVLVALDEEVQSYTVESEVPDDER